MSFHRLSQLTFSLILGIGGVVHAQDSWGPTGSVLNQQIAETLQQARPGSRSVAVGLIRGLAAEAQKSNQLEAWAWAQTGLAEQVMAAEKEEQEFIPADPVRILEEVIRRCSQEKITAPLARALSAHAECLSQLGKFISAAQEWDRAGSLAMDGNQFDQAVSLFIYAARVYLKEGHAARVRASQTYLDIIELQRSKELSQESLSAITKFRTSAAALLQLTAPAEGPLKASVSLQPVSSGILVSSSERERGSSRFTLANHSTRAISGLLTLTTGRASVHSWQTDAFGMHVQLRPTNTAQPEVRRIRLLPGEKLKLNVDYRFVGEKDNFEDVMRLSWTDDESNQDSVATYHFSSGPALRSQVINASRNVQKDGWPTPFYHELYYRGESLQVENILATSSAAARVEIYNEETGELIGIDGEGDGYFDGPNDFLEQANDRDHDGRPDLVVGPQNPVGSLEIYLFPTDRTATTTKLTLSLADYTGKPARWRPDSVNEPVSE